MDTDRGGPGSERRHPPFLRSSSSTTWMASGGSFPGQLVKETSNERGREGGPEGTGPGPKDTLETAVGEQRAVLGLAQRHGRQTLASAVGERQGAPGRQLLLPRLAVGLQPAGLCSVPGRNRDLTPASAPTRPRVPPAAAPRIPVPTTPLPAQAPPGRRSREEGREAVLPGPREAHRRRHRNHLRQLPACTVALPPRPLPVAPPTPRQAPPTPRQTPPVRRNHALSSPPAPRTSSPSPFRYELRPRAVTAAARGLRGWSRAGTSAEEAAEAWGA